MPRRTMQSKPTRFPRQLRLFAGVVLLPIAVLVAFGTRFVHQENELRVRRQELARESAARDLSAVLFERLERRAETAVRALETEPMVRYPGDGTLTYLGSRLGMAFVPAWDGVHPAAPAESPTFREFRSSGERAELVSRDATAARSLYRQALDAAKTPYENGLARLRLARVEMRAESRDAARRRIEPVAGMPIEVTDALGLPIAAYAIEMLLTLDRTSPAAVTGLARLLSDSTWIRPEVAFYLRDLATLADSAGTNTVVLAPIARLLAEMETVESLRAAPSSIQARSAQGGESVWTVLPDSTWIVRRPSAAAAEAPILALRLADLPSFLSDGSEAVFHTTGARLTDALEMDGGFEGLSISLMDAPLTDPSASRGLLVSGLLLLIAVTGLGGWVLLRDMSRESQLAKLRSQFVSSISHELRTPLTSIRMFAETLLLDEGAPIDERRENLSIIASESERLTRMLNNVLGVSSIEQGTFAIRPVLQPVGPVARRAVDALSYELGQRGMRVDISADDPLPEVKIDADAIEQALLNLLSNAMKYGRQPVIDLALRSHPDGRLILEVGDRGPGIPPEYRERVFERFYRIPENGEHRTTGTGLGLALVRHIVEYHGGTVSVADRDGGGSLFTIALKANQA